MSTAEIPKVLFLDQGQLALVLQAIQEHMSTGPREKAPFQLTVGTALCKRLREVAEEVRAQPSRFLDMVLNMFFATGMQLFRKHCLAEHFGDSEEELDRVLGIVAKQMRADDQEVQGSLQ